MTDWTQGTDLDPTKWTCPFCASQYVRHPENNLSEFLAEYTKVICYPSGEKLLEHIE
nr:hypothetical protein [Nitrosopumilus sp.]